jgi:GAF domain-containing protein
MITTSLQPIPERARLAVLDLFRLTLDADEPTIFSVTVELAVELTGSEIGYLHLVNDDQLTIELGTWSAGTLRRCTAVYDRHYPISEAGVWADSARLRRPCIHNDYQALRDRRGLPEGHVPLVRHMGVPVVSDGRVVMLAGVGNKPADYDDDELACFQALADQAWALVRRRRERASLEFAAQQLRDLEDVAAIVAWQWDPEEEQLVFDRDARGVFGVDLTGGAPCGLDALLRFVDARDHKALRDVMHEPAEDATFALDLRAVRADGATLTVHLRGAAHPRSQGHGIILRGILQDVTARRELSRIRYEAGHDALTGLANRPALLAELEASLRSRGRRPDDAFAVLFVDLDRFKEVNDPRTPGGRRGAEEGRGTPAPRDAQERSRRASRRRRDGGRAAARRQRRRREGAGVEDHRRGPAADARLGPTGRGRREHRHRDRNARQRNGRGPAGARRPRDVSGQGDAPRRISHRLNEAMSSRRSSGGAPRAVAASPTLRTRRLTVRCAPCYRKARSPPMRRSAVR